LSLSYFTIQFFIGRNLQLKWLRVNITNNENTTKIQRKYNKDFIIYYVR
jgi:hypothetical protein